MQVFKYSFLSGVFIILMALSALCDENQDVIQTPVFGTSAMVKSDIKAARNEAIKNALSKSVESAVLQVIPPESIGSDIKKIEHLLAGDPSLYIRDYKVLGESSSGKDYIVVVKANVIRSKLTGATQTNGIESAESFPKILFLVTESLSPSDQPSAWWIPEQKGVQVFEPEAAAALAVKKFAAAEHHVAPADETGKQIAVSQQPTLEEAVRLGRFYRADLVITGQVNALDAKNSVSGGLFSFPVKAEGKIIDVALGSEMGNASVQTSALDSGQAEGARKAVVQAARELTLNLVSQAGAKGWKKHSHDISPAVSPDMRVIPVVINGQDILGKMIPIRSAISSIKGIKEVKTIEMNYSRAKIEALYNGEISALVRELAVKNFENFRMEINSGSGEGITINIPDAKK